MFCKNCGRQLPDDATFCPGCGTKRSGGGESYGDGRSGADMKNLPNYAKETNVNRSGLAIDANREKFSLSDSGQNKFSLSGQKKFSLSDSGQNKFSIQDRSRKDDGGGIVRLSAGREPDPRPAEPTGFVNPLKDSGKTVFKSDSDGGEGVAHSGNDAEVRNPDVIFRSSGAGAGDADKTSSASNRFTQDSTQGGPQNGPDIGAPGADAAEPTGFVNPLKDTDQTIHWGSDGDRNTKAGDIGEIDSHMGFAIVITILGCCNCLNLVLGIVAIVFASQVSKNIQEGNFEQAKKNADIARILCWVSLGLLLFGFVFGSITGVISGILNEFKP